MKYKTVEKSYPNPAYKYIEIYTHSDRLIGKVNIVDGGFLLRGKRKAQPNIVAAARQLIADEIKDAKKRQSIEEEFETPA